MRRFLLPVTLALLGAATAAPASSQSVAQVDSLALVTFYDATDGPNGTDNTNWLTGPVSTWYGVTVENGRVTRLERREDALSGALPEELGDLGELRELTLREPPGVGDHLRLSVVEGEGSGRRMAALFRPVAAAAERSVWHVELAVEAEGRGAAFQEALDGKYVHVRLVEHAATWDGGDDQGRHVATGAYLYRLEAAGFTATHTMMLLR